MDAGFLSDILDRSAYGAAGDMLWVREVWATNAIYDDVPPREIPSDHRAGLWYRADHAPDGEEGENVRAVRGRWRPSIYLPKWAARIWLIIDDVRVERLQEITEEEAYSEGVRPVGARMDSFSGLQARNRGIETQLVWAFADLWDTLHREPGTRWDDNPYVWVVRFGRLS